MVAPLLLSSTINSACGRRTIRTFAPPPPALGPSSGSVAALFILVAFSGTTQGTVSTGKRVNTRAECHWSHAWQRFNQIKSGDAQWHSSGVTFCRKTRIVPTRWPRPVPVLGWLLGGCWLLEREEHCTISRTAGHTDGSSALSAAVPTSSFTSFPQLERFALLLLLLLKLSMFAFLFVATLVPAPAAVPPTPTQIISLVATPPTPETLSL
jgi:hypothetical protein